MSDQIYSINEILAKTGNISKAKKTDNSSVDAFSKILENAVSKTDEIKKTAETFQTSNIFSSSYINPLSRIELNNEASKFVENSLTQILSDLELFSGLLGDSSIDLEDLRPLADKIQENSNEVLRFSEKNNIPDDLKSIAKESTALAYAAFEKFGVF